MKEQLAPFLRSLILELGGLALTYFAKGQALKTRNKNNNLRDIVSEADTALETLAVQRIRESFPDHLVIGEEFGSSAERVKSSYHWHIDPIDGTVNFVRGIRNFSISIAVYQQSPQDAKDSTRPFGQPICSAVCGPALGELYSAIREQGAFLDSIGPDFSVIKREKLECSTTDELAKSLVSTGFACIRAGIHPNSYLYLGSIQPRISDIRRMGSVALDLCHLAKGNYDAFWEMGLGFYNMAAGLHILEEAVGLFSDLYGSYCDLPYSLLAGNPKIYDQLLQVFSSLEKPASGFRSFFAKEIE